MVSEERAHGKAEPSVNASIVGLRYKTKQILDALQKRVTSPNVVRALMTASVGESTVCTELMGG